MSGRAGLGDLCTINDLFLFLAALIFFFFEQPHFLFLLSSFFSLRASVAFSRKELVVFFQPATGVDSVWLRVRWSLLRRRESWSWERGSVLLWKWGSPFLRDLAGFTESRHSCCLLLAAARSPQLAVVPAARRLLLRRWSSSPSQQQLIIIITKKRSSQSSSILPLLV